jgi:hypothetical protein
LEEALDAARQRVLCARFRTLVPIAQRVLERRFVDALSESAVSIPGCAFSADP